MEYFSKFHKMTANSLAETRRTRPWADRLPPPIVMMGVPFDQVTSAQTLEIIREMVDSAEPHLMVTANVDFLAQVQKDEELQRILIEADLVVCDGTPLVWMSKMLGDPLPERVAGSDLAPLVLSAAAAAGQRVFFLGAKHEVLLEASRRVLQKWPKLQIAGIFSPPFAPLDKMDHEGICRQIRDAKTDILLVAFGCPKQEKWLAMNYRKTGAAVSIGVGATIDFLAGSVKRAPAWMQKSGLEWLYRAAQEPKRLAGRYWRDIRVVSPGLLMQFLKMRRRGKSSPKAQVTKAETSPVPSVKDVPVAVTEIAEEAGPEWDNGLYILKLPARLDAVSAREASLWAEAESGNASRIVADATETTFLDSTGTGKLVRLARLARERGGKIVLAGAKPAVNGPLKLMKLNHYFEEAPDVATAVRWFSSAV